MTSQIAAKVDSVYRTRSLGAPASGLSDQYSDGKAAKVWQLYIGEAKRRTHKYKEFMVDFLKTKSCKRILDVACGTGVDSVMLLEEGFEMFSIDASDKMLKTAYKIRWDRRKEDVFDKWEIEEANWLTLPEDIPCTNGFDALICMGNSFAHLPDFHGNQSDQKLAIENFYRMLKPGGILIIDHRNYDYILEHGKAPVKNLYYNSTTIMDIKTSLLLVNNKPTMVTLDYEMDVSQLGHRDKIQDFDDNVGRFRLSYFPHRVDDFTNLLKSIFGPESKHDIYGDFQPLTQIQDPAFYIHVIEKQPA